ncbi:MAG: hypothetical protein J6B36_07340 [Muribaculaceae bacterium]|nr:hypothetical protein [Muribaculaceae bacterium]
MEGRTEEKSTEMGEGMRNEWLGCGWPWLSPDRYCACSAACIGSLSYMLSANSALTRSAGGYRKIAHPALSLQGAKQLRDGEKSRAPPFGCASWQEGDWNRASCALFARGGTASRWRKIARSAARLRTCWVYKALEI